MVAQQVESYGVRTFSAKEMAFNILGLIHPLLFSITQVEPIWADLNGGMDQLPDLVEITTNIHTTLNQNAELKRATLLLLAATSLDCCTRLIVIISLIQLLYDYGV